MTAGPTGRFSAEWIHNGTTYEAQDAQGIGRKDDGLDGSKPSKPRWDLLPFKGVSEVVLVLGKGAEKYAPNNWRRVPGWRWRYFRAAMGHMVSWWLGERNDPEFGTHHLANAVCSYGHGFDFQFENK